jgi:DNA-binding CsgD family transcriptional regulator
VRRRTRNDHQPELKVTPVDLAQKIEAGCLSPRTSPTGDAETLARRISKLSKRERYVLELAAAGRPDAEIGGTLWITEETVKAHLRYIFGFLREGKTAPRM